MCVLCVKCVRCGVYDRIDRYMMGICVLCAVVCSVSVL